MTMAASHDRPGFSLIEVLVALTVAAVLSLALIAAQRRAFDMAETGRERWRCMDIAMALMSETPAAQLSVPTGGWVQRAMPPEGEWKMERSSVPGAGTWQTLTVRSGRSEMTFEWTGQDFTPGLKR
jgi:prepilin-type N-terminal cleavage/methylation domain-containing protein